MKVYDRDIIMEMHVAAIRGRMILPKESMVVNTYGNTF